MSRKRMNPALSEEQRRYAGILAAGMYAGLGLLLLTFALYLSGIIHPAVPIARLPHYWTMNVEEYLTAINAEYLQRAHDLTGWWWLTALTQGDYLNFLGIALLSGVTIVCFLGIIPTLLRKGDPVYAIMAAVEALILVLAASGIFAVGGH